MKSLNNRVQDLERQRSLTSGACSSQSVASASTPGISDTESDMKIKTLTAEVERLTKRVIELERGGSSSADYVKTEKDGFFVCLPDQPAGRSVVVVEQADFAVESERYSPPPTRAARTAKTKCLQANKTRKRGGEEVHALPPKKSRR